MATPQEMRDEVIARLIDESRALRVEVMQLTAGNAVLTKYLLAIMQKTQGLDASAMKQKITAEVEDFYEQMLLRMENDNPAFAAWLSAHGETDEDSAPPSSSS